MLPTFFENSSYNVQSFLSSLLNTLYSTPLQLSFAQEIFILEPSVIFLINFIVFKSVKFMTPALEHYKNKMHEQLLVFSLIHWNAVHL